MELTGKNRIEVDRMWRSPAMRSQFEEDSGFQGEQSNSREYHDAFIAWGMKRLKGAAD